MEKKKTAWILLSVLGLLIIGGVVQHNIHRAPSNGAMEYAPDQPVSWKGEIPGSGKTAGTKIPGFGKLYFPSNTRQVQMTLANPDDNDCYLIYSIYLDKPDGELLYTSEKIYPGMAVENLTLKCPLQQGDYTLYIHAAPYRSSDDTKLNDAVLKAPVAVTDN